MLNDNKKIKLSKRTLLNFILFVDRIYFSSITFSIFRKKNKRKLSVLILFFNQHFVLHNSSKQLKFPPKFHLVYRLLTNHLISLNTMEPIDICSKYLNSFHPRAQWGRVAHFSSHFSKPKHL